MIDDLNFILAQVLSDKLDDNESVLLIRFMDDNGHGHGDGGQDEPKEDGEVPLVAAATAAPFTTSAHGGATRFFLTSIHIFTFTRSHFWTKIEVKTTPTPGGTTTTTANAKEEA